MDIDIHGVKVKSCETDYGEYVIDFYPRDIDRNKVKRAINRKGYTVSHKETLENGELLSWFVERKNN
jgi:hypothetical protein